MEISGSKNMIGQQREEKRLTGNKQDKEQRDAGRESDITLKNCIS
jgi:hypothetical protein